jgi:hypothetical protein
LPTSPEFEVTIQFNSKRCWALYSRLNRAIKYEKSSFAGTSDIDEPTENVTIQDCFRQFNKPENLSLANAWYVPPILLINLKRFRGNNAKQNTFVDFPVS